MSPLSLRARVARALVLSTTALAVVVPAAHAVGFGQLGDPIGSPGTANGELSSPLFVDGRVNTAPDPDVREAFVADLVPLNDVDNNLRYRVQRLNAATGEYISTVATVETVDGQWADLVPGTIAVDDANNRLYVAFTDDLGDTNALRRFNATTGGAPVAFAASQFTAAPRLFLGNVATPLAVSPTGDVYVAGTLADDTPQIRRLNSAGTAVLNGGQPIRFPASATNADTPFLDIAVGPDGDVYALDQIIDGGGGQVARVRRFSDTGVQEFAFNPAYDPDGAGPQAAVSTASQRIAVGAAGEIYLDTDQGVAQFAADGTLDRVWGILGAGVCQFATRPLGLGMLGPDVLAIDRGTVLGQTIAQVRRFGADGGGCGFDNQAPTGVNFTGDPLNPIKNQVVTFTATATDDQGPAGLTYAWDFGSGYGAPSATATATTTFTTAGAKQVKLKVTDGDGLSTEVTKTIGVRSEAPVAAFSVAPEAPVAGQSVQFDASASTDPDGTVTGYEWDLDGDGTYEATGKTPSTTYGAAGTITVRLRVTDNDGDKQTAQRSLTVAAAPAVAPAPAPAPAPVAPSVTVAASGLTADAKGAVKVTLTCPPGGPDCKGVVTIATAGPVAAAKPKKRIVALGRATVTIPAGKTVKVTVKLSAAGRKALAKLKRVQAKVTVTTTVGGSTTARSRVVSLSAPKKAKK